MLMRRCIGNRLKSSFLVAIAPLYFIAVLVGMPSVHGDGAGHVPGFYSAAQGECGPASLEVVGGQPSPFLLPGQSGQTLRVAPDAVLDLSVKNPPTGGSVRVRLAGFPGEALQVSYPITGVGPIAKVQSIPISDYVQWGRGIYNIEGALLDSAGQAICQVTFQLHIKGFGGVAAVASAAAAGIAGAGTLANILSNLRLNQARIKVSIAVERRRHRGLRQWLPLPSWKRTLIGTFLGTFTGVAVAVLLQQGGITPLSLGKAITGLVVGGMAPVSISVALGSIIGFLRPPKGEPLKPPPSSP